MHRPFCICFLLAIVAGLATSTIDTKAKVMALRDALDSVLNDNEQQFEARADSPVACTFHACTAEILGCAKLEVDERGCKLCKCADEGVVIEQPTPCTYHSCTAEMLKCAGSLAKDENGCEKCECAAFDEDFGVELPAEPLAESTVDKGRCMLKPDAGPCRGKHQRYYFDRSANSCQKFIYGGCHGNNNNFQTLEECNEVCSKRKRSQEPSKEIACPYHDCTAEKLGCLGELAKNENGCPLCKCKDEGVVIEQPTPCTYHSCTAEMLKCAGSLVKDENGCEKCECAAFDEDFGVELPAEPLAESTVDKGRCMLKPDAGPCRGKHQRYYFDRSANSCQKFIYGGCHGNNNNFQTLEECNEVCSKRKRSQEPSKEIACPYHDCTAEKLGCLGELAKNENGCPLCKCKDEGVVIEQPTPCTYHSCTAEMLKCAGSLAKDENGCEKCECAAFDEDFGVELPAEPLAESTVDKGRCMLKPDAGPCRGKHQRYYFDRSANSCQKFIYGGCHGNNNNFQTYEECNVACVKGTVKAQEPQDPVPCLLHGCTAKILNCPGELALNENGCELCECAGIVVEQPTACQYHACTAKMLGCSGSLAKDEKGCELCACADLDQAFGVPFPEKKATAETNIDKGTCMLSPQKGPCRGKHIRYYFDRSMNVCQKFNYGGCHGNGNNFETYEDCVAACKIKDVKPYAPEPPVENLVPCPYHACTAEMLGCTFGLAKNDNECELCKCEGEGDVIVEPEFPCPYHSCTAEMLGCSGELAKNENGCKLCECADEVVEEPLVPCPAHVCTAEMLGCVSGLVKNENGCELCECEDIEVARRELELALKKLGVE
ncbi:papilin-like isoform X2 [Clavelina lepadiformis]|uniref:papilin-like isoform X2 n=1 Tax=Clavelina lepadiformis TaxID=159417 RepID=UPI00404232E5